MRTIICFAVVTILSFNKVNGQDNNAENLFKTAEEFKTKAVPDSAIVYYEKPPTNFRKMEMQKKP